MRFVSIKEKQVFYRLYRMIIAIKFHEENFLFEGIWIIYKQNPAKKGRLGLVAVRFYSVGEWSFDPVELLEIVGLCRVEWFEVCFDMGGNG